MTSPAEILISSDSIRLIYPPLSMDTGTLMRYVGRCELECYLFEGQLVRDILRAEKAVREIRERKWL
jgi:hypothetical protein